MAGRADPEGAGVAGVAGAMGETVVMEATAAMAIRIETAEMEATAVMGETAAMAAVADAAVMEPQAAAEAAGATFDPSYGVTVPFEPS